MIRDVLVLARHLSEVDIESREEFEDHFEASLVEKLAVSLGHFLKGEEHVEEIVFLLQALPFDLLV